MPITKIQPGPENEETMLSEGKNRISSYEISGESSDEETSMGIALAKLRDFMNPLIELRIPSDVVIKSIRTVKENSYSCTFKTTNYCEFRTV